MIVVITIIISTDFRVKQSSYHYPDKSFRLGVRAINPDWVSVVQEAKSEPFHVYTKRAQDKNRDVQKQGIKVGRLTGIGDKKERKLRSKGIETVSEFLIHLKSKSPALLDILSDWTPQKLDQALEECNKYASDICL